MSKQYSQKYEVYSTMLRHVNTNKLSLRDAASLKQSSKIANQIIDIDNIIPKTLHELLKVAKRNLKNIDGNKLILHIHSFMPKFDGFIVISPTDVRASVFHYESERFILNKHITSSEDVNKIQKEIQLAIANCIKAEIARRPLGGKAAAIKRVWENDRITISYTPGGRTLFELAGIELRYEFPILANRQSVETFPKLYRSIIIALGFPENSIDDIKIVDETKLGWNQ